MVLIFFDLLIFRAKQNIHYMRRAESLPAALNTRKKFLRGDGDVHLCGLFGPAVVTFAVVRADESLAEISQQWLAPAHTSFGIARHGLQMLIGCTALGVFLLVNKIPDLARIAIAVKQQTM